MLVYRMHNTQYSVVEPVSSSEGATTVHGDRISTPTSGSYDKTDKTEPSIWQPCEEFRVACRGNHERYVVYRNAPFAVHGGRSASPPGFGHEISHVEPEAKGKQRVGKTVRHGAGFYFGKLSTFFWLIFNSSCTVDFQSTLLRGGLTL